MSKLQGFLDELSDAELQALHHFRFREFMPASKEKIRLELDKRGLAVPDPLTYQAEIPADAWEKIRSCDMCPRCYSEKFYHSRETETLNYSYASVDTEVDYKTCLVCLYSEEKVKAASRPPLTAWGFLFRMLNRKI